MVSEEKRQRRQQLRKIWKEEAMNQEFISCDKRNEFDSSREDRDQKPEIVGSGCSVRRERRPHWFNNFKAKKY